MMADKFPKKDASEYQDISEDFNIFVKDQGKTESHEMFMITDAIQCQTCYHYALLGHTRTHIAHVVRQIQEQVTKSRNKFSKHVMNCSKIHKTCAFVSRIVKPKKNIR